MVRKALALCGMAITLSAAQSNAQSDFCSGARNTSFQGGEQLRFKVYYNMGRLWVAAGEASFSATSEVLNSQPVYHIIGDGKTLKSYEWFYKVRDRYESFIDAGTLAPLKFVRNVSEGGYKINQSVTFNHAAGRAVSNKGTFSTPKCVQDVLSAIYYARNIDYSKYQPGAKIPFAMFLDDEVHHLYIRYVGREKVETRYGVFNAIRIQPLLINGTLFSGGEKMSVWVTDDANHIPVRVDSPITVGSIKVDLIGYEKLKNPMTALIRKK